MTGFTLIETVVIMVILGILSVAAVPNLVNAVESIRTNAAAQKVLTDIRFVRELALSHSGTYGIEVDVAANSYNLFVVNGGVKTVLPDPHKQTPMNVDLDTEPGYGGVVLGAIDLCEGGGCPATDLRFNAFGRPQDSGGTFFVSPATITLQGGGQARTVRVTQETAFSEVI